GGLNTPKRKIRLGHLQVTLLDWDAVSDRLPIFVATSKYKSPGLKFFPGDFPSIDSHYSARRVRLVLPAPRESTRAPSRPVLEEAAASRGRSGRALHMRPVLPVQSPLELQSRNPRLRPCSEQLLPWYTSVVCLDFGKRGIRS